MKQALLVTVLLLSATVLTGCLSGQGGSKAPNCGQGSTFDTKTRTCSSAGSSEGGGRVDATIYEDSGFNTLDLPVVYVGNRLAEVCNVINYSAGIGDPAPYAPVCRCSQGVCRVTVYPTKDYTGMTSLSYNLSNARGTSGTYDMFINVISRNDNPGNATSSVNIDEDQDEIVYLNYADVDDITVQATSCTVDYLTELTEISPCACYGGVCSIVVKYSGATDPSAGVLYTGPQLRYTVQVDGYDTGRSYVAVNVLGVDDPPYNEISTTETNIGVKYEDFPSTSITLSYTDPDGFGPYTCSTSNLVGITAGACSCSGLNICTVSIAGEPEYYTDGTANKSSFNYQITSSAGSSVPRYINGTSESDEPVEITIDSVNDSPTFTNISSGGNSYVCGNTINALEDEPLVITVNIDEGGGTDEDSQDLKIEVLSSDDTIVNGQASTANKDIGINLKHGATELNYNDDLVSIPNAATSAGASDVTITLTPEPGASTLLTTITINAEDDGPGTAVLPPLHVNEATCQLFVNFAEVDDPPTVFKDGAELLDKETNEGDRLRIGSIKIDEGGGTVEDPQGIYVSILTDNKSLLPASNMELYNEATATPMAYFWDDVAYSPASDNCCSGNDCTNVGTSTAGTPDLIVTSAIANCVYLDIANQKCYRSQSINGNSWDEGPCVNSYTTSGCSGNNCLGKVSPTSRIIPDAVGVLYYAMEEDKCYMSSGLTAMDWAETGCGKKYRIDTQGGTYSSGDDSYQLKVDPVANISGEVKINIHAQDFLTSGAGFNIATSSLTGEFTLIVHSIGAIHNGWKDLKAIGAKYAFDGELLAEPYVELGWEPFLLAGSGSNSAAVINGYNVFRREAGVDYDFSSPINSDLISSTVYTYKDEDFSSTSMDDVGKVYYYVVRPVDSINNLSSPTNEIFKEIRIILPPKNRVFVHRWIVNKEVCGLLKKDSDGTHNFRCEYYGPGRGSVDGYYDIGQDLIVDMFEAGCPYTSAYDSDGVCGHNGCIGIGHPGSTTPFNLVDDEGYVYYDRGSGQCYINYPAGTWVDISSAIAGVWTPTDDFTNMTDNAWLAPLTHINQSDSNVACAAKTPIEVEFKAAAANILLGPSRLPSRREQIAYSAWDSGYSDSEISNMESGLAISSSSKCNSTSGSGITEWYTDTDLPLGKFRTTIPGTKASAIRSVMTGSEQTANCSSKYGVQDFVGNVGEWTTDIIRCTTATSCEPFPSTDFVDSADLNSPNGAGGYEYELDGETGPCNDERADGTCSAPIDGWHFYEEKYNAGYFILPMGLPADGDYPTDYFSSQTGKSMLQIGNSSGITSAQLHNDYFNIASAAITDTGNNLGQLGSVSIGGDYESGDKGGRYYLSTIPVEGSGSETTASIIIQDITYEAVEAGNSGNSIRVAYASCGLADCTETVTVAGTLITVTIDNLGAGPNPSGTDADELVALINGDASAAALVQATVTGTGTTLQTLGTSLYLTGGSATSGTTLGDVGFTVLSANAVSIIFIPGSAVATNIDNIAGVSDFIVVTIEDGVTTAQQIVDSINAAASALVTATVTGSNVAQTVSGVKLTGGSNATVTESGMTFTSTNLQDGACGAEPAIQGADVPVWTINTSIIGVACLASDAAATIECAGNLPDNNVVRLDVCRDSGQHSTFSDAKNAIDSVFSTNKLFTTTFPGDYASAIMPTITATFDTAATTATLYRTGITFTAGSNYIGADGNDWTIVYLPYNAAAGTIDVGCTVAGSVAIPNIDLAAVNDTCINVTDKALYVVVESNSSNTTATLIDTAVNGIDATPATYVEVVANAGEMTQSTHETVLSSATNSSIVIQDITYTAVTPGVAGDSILIVYEDDGNILDSVGCTVNGNTITVSFSPGIAGPPIVDPSDDIVTEINGGAGGCSALVTATEAAGLQQNISTPGYLTGGNSSGNISPAQGFRCITPVGAAVYSDSYHTYSY